MDDTHERDSTEPESSPPRREPILNLPRIVVLFMVLCAVLHALRTYVLTDDQAIDLIVYGAFIPLRYTGGYPIDLAVFTSPLTASLLHGGWAHLAINMVWLAIFGSPLATRIGALRFVLFWCMASLCAAALHFMALPEDPTPMLGASGAISGMMGAAARFGFAVDRRARLPIYRGRLLTIGETLSHRGTLIFLLAMLVLNIAAGFGFGGDADGMIAWQAHIGGLLGGFFLIPLFDRPAPREP